MFSLNNNMIKIILLPYLIILATISSKSWFITEDNKLGRNIIVKLSVFKNHLLSLSLKTGAITIILVWHLLIGIIR